MCNAGKDYADFVDFLVDEGRARRSEVLHCHKRAGQKFLHS